MKLNFKAAWCMSSLRKHTHLLYWKLFILQNQLHTICVVITLTVWFVLNPCSFMIISKSLVCCRNWPRYGLRWSGLCWHSRHSTSGAGRRPHECCAGSSSTNHSSADRMSGQLLFYHENEAIFTQWWIPRRPWRWAAMLKRPGWQRHCDDKNVHRYSVRIMDQRDVTIS